MGATAVFQDTHHEMAIAGHGLLKADHKVIHADGLGFLSPGIGLSEFLHTPKFGRGSWDSQGQVVEGVQFALKSREVLHGFGQL